MAKTSGQGRGAQRNLRKNAVRNGKAPGLPIGRPPRLAHLVPGTDRQRKRELALQVSTEATPVAGATRSRNPTPAPEDSPQHGGPENVLCLPSPEWLPHVLTVSGPVADVAAFRRAAAGPGVIPWVVNYDRLEEDWVNTLLTPPPSERGITVEGARILAGQLRERIEQQDLKAAEAAFGSLACPLDLHTLVPVPPRLLRLGPDDPIAIAWLWENWGTTWALRGVGEFADEGRTPLPDGQGGLGYRFWSADWTPWRALASVRSRWPAISFQVSVRPVSE